MTKIEPNPDLILITESWTNDTTTNEYLNLAGYELVERKDRNDTEGGRGGGILAYARKDVHAWREDVRSDFNQAATIKIKCKPNDVTCHIVYRSPNSNKENDEKLNKWISGMRGKFVIVGDFNYPDIRWDAGSAGAKGRKFYETIMDKFLQQHIETGTHSKGNILDLVLSSHDGLVTKISMEGKIV